MIVNEGGKKLPKLTTPGTSADLLTGKELIDQYGRKVEGSMPINSNEVPTFGTTELEKSGRLRATAIYRKGFYNGGTSSTSYYLPTQAGTTITPGTETITAVPSGKYTLGAVEVAGDSDLKAENIKKGVDIFGVSGTLSPGNAIYRWVRGSGGYSITIPDVPSKPKKVIMLSGSGDDFPASQNVIVNLYQTDTYDGTWVLQYQGTDWTHVDAAWFRDYPMEFSNGNLTISLEHGDFIGDYYFPSNGYYHVTLVMDE